VSGPPAWVYGLLYLASLALSHWSLAVFGVVTVWLCNGVLTAALLQLHRRQAVMVMTTCFALNLFSNILRDAPGVFLWINALMNLGAAVLAATLARRVCGAALDMRRSRRLVRFVGLAAAPTVLIFDVLAVGLLGVQGRPSLTSSLFAFNAYFLSQMLGQLLIVPTLLMLARAHRFRSGTMTSRIEAFGLIGLMAAVTAATFWWTGAPITFLPFLPMMLIALRLQPNWTAASLILLAMISGAATLSGHGPVYLTRLVPDAALVDVAPMLRRMGVYNLFVLALVATALPISTVMTERRRLEARLRARTLAAQDARRRAEDAAAARSRFLAMMSHEMRTPLNGVAGFADLLAGRAGLDAEAVRQARQIRESSDGLLMLVEDILDFARGDDSVSPEPLDLGAVAREAMTPSRAAAGDKGLRLIVDDRLPPQARFMADRRALRQALQPLVANAVKFTEAGEVVVRLDRAVDGVVIHVADTGCGIDPASRSELFEAFAQGDASIGRSHAGAGLGLALVARHVRRLGGRIEVDSRPGEGAIFTLHLPLVRAADATVPVAAPPAPEPVQDQEPMAAPCVLVVDDHPVNREVARIMLEAFGCVVVEAGDGQEALDAVPTRAFDLVLMDVRMPRMDGLEATRRIRALPGPVAALPIVAMTADAMPEDVARCLGSGMNAHLAKPISQATLFAAVNRALGGEPAPASRAA